MAGTGGGSDEAAGLDDSTAGGEDFFAGVLDSPKPFPPLATKSEDGVVEAVDATDAGWLVAIGTWKPSVTRAHTQTKMARRRRCWGESMALITSKESRSYWK